MAKLTVHGIEKLSKPGLYSDGGTLFLRVTANRTKQWIQRVTIRGERRDIGLGGYPTVPLREARITALENRLTAYRGGDPIQDKKDARRKATMPTFEVANSAILKSKAARWKGGDASGTANQWRQSMSKYVLPVVGQMPLDQIQQEQILEILVPIWTARPAIARKLRQRLSAVFEYGMAHRHIRTNPAGECINGALPSQVTVKAHHRALPYHDVSAALRAFDNSTSCASGRLALRLMILTASRQVEVRGATWDEFDIDAATWTIPAARMKTGKEHRIPLSAPALAVLDRARALGDGTGVVFPSPRGRGNPLSDAALAHALRGVGLADKTTVHGLRSSFRDWCADTGKTRELAEAALSHVVSGTEGAYFRSDLFSRRRVLMGQWADYVTQTERKVVSING